MNQSWMVNRNWRENGPLKDLDACDMDKCCEVLERVLSRRYWEGLNEIECLRIIREKGFKLGLDHETIFEYESKFARKMGESND